jgi:hypothetical protein
MTRENTLTPFEIMHQNEKLNTGGYDYKRGFLDATQIAKDIYTETQNDLLEALEGLVEAAQSADELILAGMLRIAYQNSNRKSTRPIMKLINTRYGILNTHRGDEIEFSYHLYNYKAIALYGLYIALGGLFLFTAFRGWL